MSFIVFVLGANQQQIISLSLEYLFIHQLGLLSSETVERSLRMKYILLITYKSPLNLNIHPPTQIIIVDEIHLANHL
jgi:hypothetical protein